VSRENCLILDSPSIERVGSGGGAKRQLPKIPPVASFEVADYLESGGASRRVKKYRKGALVFSQGDRARDVCYLREGVVKLTVLSRIGKEAVVGILAPGDFFGEGVLAGQSTRLITAKAMSPSTVLCVGKDVMTRLLHTEPTFSDRFIKHMLARNLRIEADLVDQLFNSIERRLARTLLLLVRYGQVNPDAILPKISQETLAEMIGTTRTRVNFFMNKFRRLGYIEYNGGIKIHAALLNIVLHD
jgi:CRP/FNR family cyclic AMP-dependent transcriptional regulator